MRKLLKILIINIMLITASSGFAQGPPDPDPDPSGGNNDVGGSAPIGSGIAFLLVSASLYATRKVFFQKKLEN